VLGKLFGGAFGFMVGGPLGALLGAAVGHNFDQGVWKAGSAADKAGQQERIQSTFHTIAFQLMGHIAKADGRVSEVEIAAARAIMDHLGLDADQRRTAINCFTEGKQPDFAVGAALETFQHICSGRFALLQQMLEMQLNVAYADGNLHPKTHARLVSIAERLGVPRLQFEALHNLFRAQHWARRQSQGGRAGAGDGQTHEHRTHGSRPTTAVNSLGQAYSVLGLQRDASPAEIKLAYRRLLKRHHPDKLAASSASPAEMKRATEKTREITAAYERIREARGF
jgi:DnaJ like chaperone protein